MNNASSNHPPGNHPPGNQSPGNKAPGNKAIVALGSNINPETNIQAAIDILNESFNVLKHARWLKTKAVDVAYEQADFINTGCLISTQSSQIELISNLKKIELQLGRQPGSCEEPRTIDLDLAVWNDDIVDEDVYKRDFLQTIISELAPQLKNKLTNNSSTEL